LQRELTYDGLRAAKPKGNKGGRRPAVTAGKTENVRAAYLDGQPIAALAREHEVSRGTIRTAVADPLPEHAAVGHENAPAPEMAVTLDMPGKVADFLRTAELDDASGRARRQLLAHCQPLDGIQGTSVVPAQRKARRKYENQVSTLTPT
ncbi:recombinase family protein, partial [Streptomyces sp. MCAF7]